MQTLRNPKPKRTKSSGEVGLVIVLYGLNIRELPSSLTPLNNHRHVQVRVSGAALSDSPESCHIVVVTADKIRTYNSSHSNNVATVSVAELPSVLCV